MQPVHDSIKNLLLALILCLTATCLLSQDKYALIIAAGSYPQQSGWRSLASANDAELIRDALVDRGFKARDVVVLSEDVSKANMVKAFNEGLLNKVKKGDVVFFHFSGHGYQIPDDDGDEVDGYDESLVPADAVYDGGRIEGPSFYANYLRDDELGDMLDALRLKLGSSGNLMVSIDACHSGTATRGMGPARGMAREASDMGKADFSGDENADFGFSKATGGMANMACFFASSENQLNYEYHTRELKCGSLSYALAKALDETEAQVSYKALFDRVRGIMAGIVPGQTPHAEGEFDQVIFGGALLERVDYHRVNKVEADGTLQINAGKLSAVHEGSIVGFYPPDTRIATGAQPLAKGVVVSARTRDAMVRLTEGSMSAAQAAEAWALVLEKNYGDMSVTLHIDAAGTHSRTQIAEQLASYPFITLVDSMPADLWLEIGKVEGKPMNEVRLTTSQGHVQYRAKLTSSPGDSALTAVQVNEVVARLKTYAQCQYLRTFEFRNPAYDVDIRFIPLRKKEGTSGRNPHTDYEELDAGHFYKSDMGIPELEVGSYFRLEVINRSRQPLYFSVIDIMPNNTMEVLFPAPGSTAQEYRVGAMDVQQSAKNIFQVGPPLGDDVVKLIVSKTPMELGSIVESRGSHVSDNPNNFELFMQNLFKEAEGTRGPAVENVDLEDIGVYGFMYRIVDKESSVKK